MTSTTENPLPVSLQQISEAAQRIAPYAHLTPVMTCATLDRLSGKQLFFKCELFQKVGAFKFRGACNAVMKLPAEVAAKGVVTHSSGNHGQALALAANLRGIPCHVIMPNNAPPVKKQACLGYGAKVVECEPTLQSRESTAEHVIKESGGLLIHPYNDVDIIAGQGTIALELLDQVRDLDAIIVPVGGGGMISGISIAAKAKNPNIKIFAAEPKGADDCARSMKQGERVGLASHEVNTVADGLRTNILGTLTWPVIQQSVTAVITVTEEEILSAMRLVWERMKLVIEPSAAVGVAVAISEQFKNVAGSDVNKVGVVLCGGNVDLDNVKWK